MDNAVLQRSGFTATTGVCCEVVNKSSRAAPSARSRGASNETYQLDRRGASEHATQRSGCAVDLFTASDVGPGTTPSLARHSDAIRNPVGAEADTRPATARCGRNRVSREFDGLERRNRPKDQARTSRDVWPSEAIDATMFPFPWLVVSSNITVGATIRSTYRVFLFALLIVTACPAWPGDRGLELFKDVLAKGRECEAGKTGSEVVSCYVKASPSKCESYI